MNTLSRCLLALAVAGSWFAGVRFAAVRAGLFHDDTYIYFRYVDNLFGACPLAYNCADGPIEGFTSPLYLAGLALGATLVPDLERLAHLLGPLLLGLTFAALAFCAAPLLDDARQTTRAHFIGIAALFALTLDDFVLLNANSGFETALVAWIATLVFFAALRERHPGLRTLLVLGVLARPECALFVVFLPVLPRTRSLRYWAPLIAAGSAIVAVRWFVYHDLFPNTFWAKSGGTARHFELGLAYIGECLTNFPLILASPLALLRARRAAVPYALLVSAAWCLFFLRSGGGAAEYGRLLFPLVPVLTLLGIAGLDALFERGTGGRRIAGVPLAGVMLAGLLACLGSWTLYAHAIRPLDTHPKIERWKKVGTFLKQRHPGWTVATTPIGAIGWISGAHIIDLVGLTSREVAHHGAFEPNFSRNHIGHERYATDWVLAQKPDLLVMMAWSPDPIPSGKRHIARFAAEWDLLRRIHDGSAPYSPYHPEIESGLHWFMYVRNDHLPALGNRLP